MKINKREFFQELGRRLTMLRRQLGYSRTELAKRFGITTNAIGKNERGESFPNTQTLHCLASDLDISMDWLFFDKEPMYYKKKKTIEKLEQETAELQKELDRVRQQIALKEQEKPGKNGEMETAALTELAPDVRDLVEHMAKIPLLHYEILAHFHRFKMENIDYPAAVPSTKKRKTSK